MTAAAAAALRVGDRVAARGRQWQVATENGWYWAGGYVEVPVWAVYSDGSTSGVHRRIRLPLDA